MLHDDTCKEGGGKAEMEDTFLVSDADLFSVLFLGKFIAQNPINTLKYSRYVTNYGFLPN